MTQRDHPDGIDIVGNVQELLETWYRVDPEETGRESLVDRRQQDVLHGRSCIDPPIRNRPMLALPVVLVRLVVPVSIHLLGAADDDVDRCRGDPWIEACRDVVRFVGQFGNPESSVCSLHNHERLTLAESGARRPPARVDDPLYGIGVDRLVCVGADHAPLADDVAELHPQHSSTVAAVEPASPTSQRRIRELAIGVGSAAGILALIIAPWWLIDVLLIGGGVLTLWWARQVPLERVISSRAARPRLVPVVALSLAGMVAFSAYQFVTRLSLLLMAASFALAAGLLVSRWYGFVRHA